MRRTLLVSLLIVLFGFGCKSPASEIVAEESVPQDVSVDVSEPATVGKTSVALFFVDEGDEETCEAGGYEKRTFAKTAQIAELAITELLKGSQKKMRTEIPEGTTLSQVIIENGVATVNFNSENEARWSGGSCHVNLIRSQITQTLMQIEGVTDVAITVNGKTEADGILQP